MRQRRIENKRAHREQAESISAWYSGASRIDDASNVPDGIAINLFNASEQMVYEVVVVHVFIQGAAPHTGEERMSLFATRWTDVTEVLGSLPPGRSAVKVKEVGGVMAGTHGAEIAFTDSSGHHWIRRAGGQLDEITSNALEHYGIGRPVLYTTPLPPYVDPGPT